MHAKTDLVVHAKNNSVVHTDAAADDDDDADDDDVDDDDDDGDGDDDADGADAADDDDVDDDDDGGTRTRPTFVVDCFAVPRVGGGTLIRISPLCSYDGDDGDDDDDGNWSWKSSACACRTARKMMRLLCLCVCTGTWTFLPHPTPPVTDHEWAVPVSAGQQERWWGCCACARQGHEWYYPHPTGNWSWKSSACVCRTARKMIRLLCLCVHRSMNVITPPHPTPPVTDHERAVPVSAGQQERW